METNISLRIDTDLYNEIKKQASKEERSLASYIRYILKKAVKK